MSYSNFACLSYKIAMPPPPPSQFEGLMQLLMFVIYKASPDHEGFLALDRLRLCFLH